MKRTLRPDEPSGSKTIHDIRDVFGSDDKFSRRIFIKGEAGSGKSVFCLKLVESWCQIKQSPKVEHVCEKQSKLITQLITEADSSLAILLRDLDISIFEFKDKVSCTTCEMQHCLSEFDLLYFVAMRDATEGKISVVDFVCDATCNDCKDLIDRTRQLLSNEDVRCLIILDGLDEWPHPPEFTGFPNTRGLSNKCVLLSTMRPWKLVHLRMTPKSDDRITTVCGLSGQSVAKIIENILFKIYGMEGEKLKSRFVDYCKKVTEETITGIMRIPMMLIAACHLWCEDGSGCSESIVNVHSFSRTHLYLSLLNQMIKTAANRKCKQEGRKQNSVALYLEEKEENPSTQPGLSASLSKFHYVSHVYDMLQPFCELAYKDLLSPETKLVFLKGKLETQLGESQVELAHKLGLISQAKVRGKLNDPQNVSVSFYHKSVQELLAAMHLSRGDTDTVTSFREYCSSVEKVMEMGTLIMFVMGLEPRLGCELSEHINEITNRDKDFGEYRLMFLNELKVQQLFQTQSVWYREIKYRKVCTDDASPLPTMYVSDIFLDPSIDSDAVRLTEDLISSNLNNIVSVTLWSVEHPLHGLLQYLPQCPRLSALVRCYSGRKEDSDKFLAVLPALIHLDALCFIGCDDVPSNSATEVNAILQLTQLRYIVLHRVGLGDDRLVVTLDMPRLQTVKFSWVSMSSGGWCGFISSLPTIQHPVHVIFEGTNIDDDIARRVQMSAQFNVTRDDKNGEFTWVYGWLEFITVPSHTDDGQS